MNTEDQELSEFPEALKNVLRQADTVAPLIPKSLDDEILAMAREQFADRPEDGSSRTWYYPAGLAATALLGVWIFTNVTLFPANEFLADDFDGSGQVDVLDAFALARQQDFSDPQVQQQVQTLMSRIVTIAPGGNTR